MMVASSLRAQSLGISYHFFSVKTHQMIQAHKDQCRECFYLRFENSSQCPLNHHSPWKVIEPKLNVVWMIYFTRY